MSPIAITVTIHPQSGVSYESLLFTLTIGPTTGDGVSVSVELLIWAGVAFAGGVGEDCGVYEGVGSVEGSVGAGAVAGVEVG